MHAQAFRAGGRAIGVARHVFVAVIIAWNGGDALPVRHRLIHIPEVVGGIDCHIDREQVRSNNGALVEGPIVGCAEKVSQPMLKSASATTWLKQHLTFSRKR
jgi:hypothetical protein